MQARIKPFFPFVIDCLHPPPATVLNLYPQRARGGIESFLRRWPTYARTEKNITAALFFPRAHAQDGIRSFDSFGQRCG
jgi:hypothetical protein